MRFSRVLIPVLAALLLVPAAASAAVGDPVLVSSPGALGTLPSQGANGAGSVEQLSEEDRVAVSDDGRYSVFSSQSDGLAPDDDDRHANVFRKDAATGIVTLISRADGPAGAAADGYSFSPSISDDGNLVAFTTAATNLAAGDTDPYHDVYVRNVSANTTTLISVGGPDCGSPASVHDGDCGRAMISGNGQFVAYATDAVLTAADSGTTRDVYRRTAGGKTPVLISQVEGSAPLRKGNGASSDPSISDDGSLVAFTSVATDLPDNPPVVDLNGDEDVFVRTVSTGHVRVVSAASGSASQTLANSSYRPFISGDGSAVVFSSAAKNVDPTAADTDGNADTYVRVLGTMKNSLVDRATGPSGVKSDGFVNTPRGISDDGRWVLFQADASNLGGASQRARNVYARQVIAGTTVALSTGPQGPSTATLGGAISGDGGWALVVSDTPLDGTVARDEREVYERSIAAPPGAAEVVSRPPGADAYAATDIGVQNGKGGAVPRQVSGDGRYVVFTSGSNGLSDLDLDDRRVQNVYRRDLLTGAIELISGRRVRPAWAATRPAAARRSARMVSGWRSSARRRTWG